MLFRSVVSIFDYATGRSIKSDQTIVSVGQEQHGHQRDAHGDIWHFYVESGTSASDQPGYRTYNTIDWYGPEVVLPTRVVMRVMATSLVVDKASGTIIDSYRREDIKTYEPLSKDTVQVSYTSKNFDSRGNPRDLQTGVSIHRRIAPFAAVDSAGSNDYRAMFCDYLISRHLDSLLPLSGKP